MAATTTLRNTNAQARVRVRGSMVDSGTLRIADESAQLSRKELRWLQGLQLSSGTGRNAKLLSF